MSEQNTSRDENVLRSTQVRQSLCRPQLFMGAERELMLLLLLVCVGLVIMAQTLVTTILSIVLWICLVPLLRSMAKADPAMSKIFLRTRRYQKYYAARSTPNVQ